MYESFAKSLYKSAAWRKLSKAYMQSQHYTCERCGRLAVICHHKTYLTPQNWRDPNVALNWDNLESLCMDCHNQEHFKRYGVTREGLRFDSDGQLVEEVIKTPPTSEGVQRVLGIETGLNFSSP